MTTPPTTTTATATTVQLLTTPIQGPNPNHLAFMHPERRAAVLSAQAAPTSPDGSTLPVFKVVSGPRSTAQTAAGKGHNRSSKGSKGRRFRIRLRRRS